jgi:beta-mannanase
VRTVFDWASIEPEPGVYRWERFDRAVEQLRERGVAILGILHGSAPWATSAPSLDEPHWQTWSTKDLNAFARYVGAVVERYDGDGRADAPGSPVIRYWEVWNEPNTAFFWRPRASAEEYVRLLRASYGAIKLAYPSAVVVLGGMAGNGVSYPPFGLAEEEQNFLQQIYDHGGKGFFDVANVHLYPYTYELARPELMTTLQDALDETRSVMAANGDGDKPIWVTEIGFSTALFPDDYESQPDEVIASWLGSIYRQLSGAEAVFWYMFEDEGTDENPEGHFGLVEHDGKLKESYYAYRDVTRP